MTAVCFFISMIPIDCKITKFSVYLYSNIYCTSTVIYTVQVQGKITNLQATWIIVIESK